MFCEADILCLTDHPELTDRYAQWQHSKWGVSVQDYLDSMDEATRSQSGVPAWYAVLDDDGNIIAGLGVIENDFHKRPDLTPNVCAVYVEPAFRGKGLVRRMMENLCRDMAQMGQTDLFLLTDHTRFYEKLGWQFQEMVQENGGDFARCYHISLEPYFER